MGSPVAKPGMRRAARAPPALAVPGPALGGGAAGPPRLTPQVREVRPGGGRRMLRRSAVRGPVAPPVLTTPGPALGAAQADPPTLTPIRGGRRRRARGPRVERPPPGMGRDGVRLLQWNADGVASKKVELTKYLHDTQPDLVAIQESKLRDGDEFTMSGYHVIRADRRRGRRDDTQAGGGVITLDQMIQICMLRPMASKPFDWDDPELPALSAYVQSLKN